MRELKCSIDAYDNQYAFAKEFSKREIEIKFAFCFTVFTFSINICFLNKTKH